MLKKIVAFGLTHRPIIVLAVLLFIGGGLIAVTQLNVEAYPNPAPVILEITAQAPGLSAEEIERYYTTPMEIGLYSTPGISNATSLRYGGAYGTYPCLSRRRYISARHSAGGPSSNLWKSGWLGSMPQAVARLCSQRR